MALPVFSFGTVSPTSAMPNVKIAATTPLVSPNVFDKWFYLDATRDYYYFDPDTGVPLNALELHDLMAPLVPRVETWQHPFVPESGADETAGANTKTCW